MVTLIGEFEALLAMDLRDGPSTIYMYPQHRRRRETRRQQRRRQQQGLGPRRLYEQDADNTGTETTITLGDQGTGAKHQNSHDTMHSTEGERQHAAEPHWIQQQHPQLQHPHDL
jgi:hypothetical protein